jgi:hypothetical protein
MRPMSPMPMIPTLLLDSMAMMAAACVSRLNFTRYATSSEVIQPMVGKRERDGVDAAVEEKSRAQTLAGSTAHKRISPSSKKLCPPFSTLLTIPKSQSLIPQPTCLPRRRSSAVRRRTSR